jgi:hypothetical protein
VVLTASGSEWGARIKRLAARVPSIDIFGNGHVLRDDEGWEITGEGRDFLAMLEAVTQDNLPVEADPHAAHADSFAERGDLIVVGHRFRNSAHRPGATVRKFRAASHATNALRGENASS